MDRDPAHLLDMILAGRRAIEGLGEANHEAIESDWRLEAIVLHQLMIFGEAAKRISREFRSLHPEIPWNLATGLRDVITHQYDRILHKRIWEIIHHELPPLLAQLESIAPQRPPEEKTR